MDQHDLIADLKNVAIDLGRTPTRDEYKRLGKYRTRYETHFGVWSAFVIAAGLDIAYKTRKVDNSIFEKDIQRHIEQYEPEDYKAPKTFPSVAIISDIHWPFSCQRVIDAFYSYCEKKSPAWIIINGDAWDMYSHSKYPRSHNVFTPREEQKLSREMNESFWKKIQAVSPQSRFVQMMGNHDIRPMKRILEEYPEAEDWVKEKLQSLFSYQRVETIFDPRQELFLNEESIVFHGYRSKLGDHRDYTLLNCFNGHTHVGGVVWKKIRGSVLFEANSGVAGDPFAKGLTYTPQKITHWTPGFLGCDEYGPRFIPA